MHIIQKSMSIVPKDHSKVLEKEITNSHSMFEFTKNASKHCFTPKVNFDKHFFSTLPLFHLSHTNEEKETRLSLNIRFKNLFLLMD